MERRAACPSRPAWPALSERFDRRGMGADRAFHPAAALWRPRAEDRHARGHERDPLRAGDRLPVAGAAQGLAAALDRVADNKGRRSVDREGVSEFSKAMRKRSSFSCAFNLAVLLIVRH